MLTLKRCSRCYNEKILELFSKNATTKDGLQHTCKMCIAFYNALHSDKNKAKAAAWYKTNRDRGKASRLAYHNANRERLRAYMITYYKTNNENIKRKVATWKKINPEKANTLNHQYRARKRGVGGSHTTAEWEKLKGLYKNCCAYCGKIEPLHRDHIIPLILGDASSNNISNIIPACRSCNSSKGTKTKPVLKDVCVFERLE